MKALRLFALGFALAFVAVPAPAQVYYTVPGPIGPDGRATTTLRQINPDGTGNVVVILPGVPAPQVPTISRDGRFLALTSLDPEHPLDQSQSVFEWDRLTGNVGRVIEFQDAGLTVFSPISKAYSPDSLLLAVSLTTSSFPAAVTELRIHDLTTGLLLGPPLTTPTQDGRSTSGAGVDWSPDGTRIVYPIRVIGPNGRVSCLAQGSRW